MLSAECDDYVLTVDDDDGDDDGNAMIARDNHEFVLRLSLPPAYRV